MRPSIALLLPALLLTACAAGESPGGDAADQGPLADLGAPPDLVPPGPLPRPALGPQLDRIGRPLTAPMMVDSFRSPWDPKATDMVRDQYNHDGDSAHWTATWTAQFAYSLAQWDSADGACGNQPLAGPMAAPGRYDALAAVLADDQLYVDTSAASCANGYFTVEGAALGLGPSMDCGGRTPLTDMDATFFPLLIGSAAGVNTRDGTLLPYDDAVYKDEARPSTGLAFPFLLPPNP